MLSHPHTYERDNWVRSESTNPIDLDLDRLVRRDRLSPMKMNAFVSFDAI